MHPKQAKALADSIGKSPLLLGDLPEARQFDRSTLGLGQGWLDLNSNQKLGHLYEDVLSRMIIQSSQLELIAKHVQIFSEDRVTLGELDFLIFEAKRKRYIHLELAVKFYLAIEIEGVWRYPGPDPRDHWERKLDRMVSHQFKLAQSPEAKALLHNKWHIHEIEPRHLIYGAIFSPIDTPLIPLPRAVAPDCRQGIWLFQRQWETHFQADQKVCHVPKYLWPAEIDSGLRDNLGLTSAPELKQIAGQRCVLFTLPDSPVPYFLVPDSWPNIPADPDE